METANAGSELKTYFIKTQTVFADSKIFLLMDNTSLIHDFYMVTLKEGNEKNQIKQASYTKIANFCPQPSSPSLVCFGASTALNRK